MSYIGRAPNTIVSENTFDEFNFTATSNQTTFTGVDSDGKTLLYNAGNMEVFLNGVRLEEADFTATNGTSVVLATGATTGDVMSVKSFSAFQVGDAVSKASGGAFGGNVSVSGTVTATSYNGDGSNLSGISTDLVLDITPQLGGNLDLNSKNITGTGDIDITGLLQLNRLTTHGDIINLQKDGTEVGSIGIESSGFYVDGEASHAGLKLFASSVAPRQNGADVDATIDLGWSGGKFKDLYLSGDAIVDGHLRLYTTDDQAHQWYAYTYTDDTLRLNYDGVGNDEVIFHTNGNIDFASNTTTAVRINSNARTSTGLNVGGAGSTSTGIYVDNSDGGATLDIAMLGSSYGAHGASAGEVWFYSPDNINIGGATGSSNTINFLGGGRKNIQFYNEGVVFFPEVGTRGDITFPICSISNNGSSNRYLHAQFQAQGGDMLHIHFRGYEYIGGAIKSGSGGGYIYNTGGQTTIYAQALSGNCAAVHQTTTNRVEIVVDTGTSQVGNRWGSYVFFGGTDTITANSPLSLVQYGWSSSSGRLYSS